MISAVLRAEVVHQGDAEMDFGGLANRILCRDPFAKGLEPANLHLDPASDPVSPAVLAEPPVRVPPGAEGLVPEPGGRAVQPRTVWSDASNGAGANRLRKNSRSTGAVLPDRLGGCAFAGCGGRCPAEHAVEQGGWGPGSRKRALRGNLRQALALPVGVQ
jgi:hypothetical protein